MEIKTILFTAKFNFNKNASQKCSNLIITLNQKRISKVQWTELNFKEIMTYNVIYVQEFVVYLLN